MRIFLYKFFIVIFFLTSCGYQSKPNFQEIVEICLIDFEPDYIKDGFSYKPYVVKENQLVLSTKIPKSKKLCALDQLDVPSDLYNFFNQALDITYDTYSGYTREEWNDIRLNWTSYTGERGLEFSIYIYND
tara:strand:- start:39 stop:431 length:393 start_codon:yes stop_codon:yes gene_type:complete